MGRFAKDIGTMHDLFIHQLEDIYYAEERLVEVLPRMIEKAYSPHLRKGLQRHLVETGDHVKRVEQVFQMHGLEPQPVNCFAIDGIVEEADEIAGSVIDKNVLDMALIAAAQAAEHYEMTRYAALVAWAKQLRREDCANVLQLNFDEVKAADESLSDLAESRINRMPGRTTR